MTTEQIKTLVEREAEKGIWSILAGRSETVHRNVGKGCNYESYILDKDYKAIAKAIATLYEQSILPKLLEQEKRKAFEWIPIQKEMPPTKKNVLTTTGKGISIAFYTKAHETEFGDEDYNGPWDEVEEKSGCLYLKEGWYEVEETDGGTYDEIFAPRLVTHWMELPPNIKSSSTQSKEETNKQ